MKTIQTLKEKARNKAAKRYYDLKQELTNKRMPTEHIKEELDKQIEDLILR